jgi:hypothetical protein
MKLCPFSGDVTMFKGRHFDRLLILLSLGT